MPPLQELHAAVGVNKLPVQEIEDQSLIYAVPARKWLLIDGSRSPQVSLPPYANATDRNRLTIVKARSALCCAIDIVLDGGYEHR